MVAQAVWAGIWALGWKIQRGNTAINRRCHRMVSDIKDIQYHLLHGLVYCTCRNHLLNQWKHMDFCEIDHSTCSVQLHTWVFITGHALFWVFIYFIFFSQLWNWYWCYLSSFFFQFCQEMNMYHWGSLRYIAWWLHLYLLSYGCQNRFSEHSSPRIHRIKRRKDFLLVLRTLRIYSHKHFLLPLSSISYSHCIVPIPHTYL